MKNEEDEEYMGCKHRIKQELNVKIENEEIPFEHEVDVSFVECDGPTVHEVPIIKSELLWSVKEEISDENIQGPSSVKDVIIKKYSDTTIMHYETQSQEYACNYCHKIYTKKNALSSPLNNTFEDSIHRCDTCDKMFKSKLMIHDRTQGLYKCDMCVKLFKSKVLLRLHMSGVHSSITHYCPVCCRGFKRKGNLKQHIKGVHGKEEHECETCKKIFKSKQALCRHVQSLHSSTGSGATRSGIEQMQCNMMNHKHQKLLFRRYTCDHCQKVYKTKGRLVVHIARSHSDISYKCELCNKVFKCKRYLLNHIAIMHTAEQHRCDLCSKVFSAKLLLEKHVVRVHSPIRHVCSICTREFKTKTHLQRHMSTHIGERHECEVCNKVFKAKHLMSAHVKNVHRAKSFKRRQLYMCNICEKVFESKLGLRKHEERGKCSHPTTSAEVEISVAGSSSRLQNAMTLKEELVETDLEVGPVVFQHMDCNYRPFEER